MYKNHNPANFKKTWQTKLSFANADILRAAHKMNNEDVEKYVQFNHNKLTNESAEVSIAKVDHQVLGQLVKGLSRGLSVEQVIAEIANEINVIKNFLAMCNSIDSYRKKLRTMISVEKEKLVTLESSFEILNKLARPKPYMTIPKNGEAASADTRKFIAKPTLNEVLLTSILIATYRGNLMQYSTPLGQTHYQIFGSRIISNSSNSDVIKRFGYIRFSSYIAEYNLYKHRGLALANTYQYFKSFDLSKFFQSIDIDLVADILAKKLVNTNVRNRYFNQYSYRNIVSSLLKFKYISSVDSNGDNVYTEHTEGLTIESHAQHTLANVYLFSLMQEILEEYNAVYHDDVKKSETISYVDDFVIYSDDKDEIERLFSFIAKNLSKYGININSKKSTDVLLTSESYSTIKELIRLPARYYFDIPVSSEYLSDNEVLPLATAIEYDSTMYTQISMEYGDYLTLTNGKSIVDEMIRITTSNLAFSNMDSSDRLLVLEIAKKVLAMNTRHTHVYSHAPIDVLNILFCGMICRDVMQVTNHKIGNVLQLISWMEGVLDCKIINDVEWKFRNAMYLIKGSTTENYLNPFLVNSTLQRSFLELTDFIYMLNNYEYLSFFDTNRAKEMVNNLNDDNILEVLQYFFMTSSVSADINVDTNINVFKELTHKILTKYPSKIRFMVSILRQAFTNRSVDCTTANESSSHLKISKGFNELEFSSFIRNSIERVVNNLHHANKSVISSNMSANLEELKGFDFILGGTSDRAVISAISTTGYSRTFNKPTLHSLTYFAYRAQRVLNSEKV